MDLARNVVTDIYTLCSSLLTELSAVKSLQSVDYDVIMSDVFHKYNMDEEELYGDNLKTEVTTFIPNGYEEGVSMSALDGAKVILIHRVFSINVPAIPHYRFLKAKVKVVTTDGRYDDFLRLYTVTGSKYPTKLKFDIPERHIHVAEVPFVVDQNPLEFYIEKDEPSYELMEKVEVKLLYFPTTKPSHQRSIFEHIKGS